MSKCYKRELTKEEALECLISSTFYLKVNMDDVFEWGTSDSFDLTGRDVLHLLPLYQKYHHNALVAYEAINRGYDPQVSTNITKEFLLAKDEILSLLDNHPDGDVFPDLTKTLKTRLEEKVIFNGKEVLYKVQKLTFVEKIIAFIKREKYPMGKQIAFLDSGEQAIANNRYKAKNALIDRYNEIHGKRKAG